MSSLQTSWICTATTVLDAAGVRPPRAATDPGCCREAEPAPECRAVCVHPLPTRPPATAAKEGSMHACIDGTGSEVLRELACACHLHAQPRPELTYCPTGRSACPVRARSQLRSLLRRTGLWREPRTARAPRVAGRRPRAPLHGRP